MTDESTTLNAETGLAERDEALAPILAALGEGPPEAPAPLPLGAWERELLSRALRHDERTPDWAGALVEAVALQVKLNGDHPPLATESEPAEPDGESSTRDVAIGIALLDELQATIDGLILAGAMSDAKRLSSFRNRLSNAVGTRRDLLTDEQAAEAKRRATTMKRARPTGPTLESRTREEEPKRSGLTAEPIRSSSARIGRIVSVEQPPRSQVKRLALALVAATVVWGVLVMPRYFREPLPVLTIGELPAHAAIRDVSARPPSLYVTVDGAMWRQMNGDARRDLTDEVGISAQQFGYSGAVVRDETGQVVSEWLKHSGSRVITLSTSAKGS